MGEFTDDLLDFRKAIAEALTGTLTEGKLCGMDKDEAERTIDAIIEVCGKAHCTDEAGISAVYDDCMAEIERIFKEYSDPQSESIAVKA